MNRPFSSDARPWHGGWRVALTLALALAGAREAGAQTVHAVFESAWSRQPAQRAQTERRNELDARLRAADGWTPEPGSISLSQRGDQPGSKLGRRESEVEFATPLWLPGQRGRQRAVVVAERDSYDASQQLARWRLAGEVREAWWQARLAQADAELAQQRAASLQALAADVARRVKAGELARVDANRAQAEQRSARIALGDADASAFRALQQYSALTGTPDLPRLDEGAGVDEEGATRHPLRLFAYHQTTLARQRIAYVAATRRDAPELSLGVTRERTTVAEPYGSSVVLRLKVPFAGSARNDTRMATAQAERAEAESEAELGEARVAADIASARRELVQARAAQVLAQERAELARDSLQLLDRSFKLGELDLPSRLRAEAEHFEAERLLSRARLQAGRAVSTLNQALGTLP